MKEINSVREICFAKDELSTALGNCYRCKKDFVELFEVMGDLPVTIHLLTLHA